MSISVDHLGPLIDALAEAVAERVSVLLDGRESERRLTVQRREAARMLGVSLDSFEKHIQPELQVIRRGSLRLVRVAELERWAEENAALSVDRR